MYLLAIYTLIAVILAAYFTQIFKTFWTAFKSLLWWLASIYNISPILANSNEWFDIFLLMYLSFTASHFRERWDTLQRWAFQFPMNIKKGASNFIRIALILLTFTSCHCYTRHVWVSSRVVLQCLIHTSNQPVTLDGPGHSFFFAYEPFLYQQLL